MAPEQIDQLLTYAIYVTLGGLGVALMMYVVAKVGQRSARGAGIVAGISSLLYVGVGVAGAAVRVELGITPADDAPADAKAEATEPEVEADVPPEVDPAIEEAAVALREALTAADWEAAAAAHDALKALDAEHPELADAWTKIEEGRAAEAATEGETEGTGGETEGTGGETGGSDEGGSTGALPVGAEDEGEDEGELEIEEPEPEPEPEPEAEEPEPEPKPKKKPKKKRRKKPRPQPAEGGDDGGEPEPKAEPKDEPKPEPKDEPKEDKPKKPALLEPDTPPKVPGGGGDEG